MNDIFDKYNKWKSGINYITGRKITIGGKIHKKLETEFKVTDAHHFSDMENINCEEYNEETNDLAVQKKMIDEENVSIDMYNSILRNIEKEIDILTDWNSFVEFEGIKYGAIGKTRNGIHIENNCGGEIESKTITGYCTCNSCENWGGCAYYSDRKGGGRSVSMVSDYYEWCVKCDYKQR